MIRLLSAAVLLAIVIVTVWFLPPLATVVLTAFAAAVAATELSAIFRNLGAEVSPTFLAITASVTCVAVYLTVPELGAVDDAPVLVLLALVVATGAMALGSGPPSAATVTRAGLTFMAPLYVGLPLGAIAWIQAVDGPYALSFMIVLLIASDSAQFYAGRLTGRRKLAPIVSPAKTVEGAIGGLVAAGVIGAWLGPRWIPGVEFATGALLGVVLGTLGIVGDLFESLLKRSAGVKDSSPLIPGHGGMLDRIDSWLFAAPAYYVFLRYFA